jgi:allene oxide cyclase
MTAKRKLPIAAVVLTAALGSAFLAGPAAADETITLVERAASDTVTDLGAKGDSAGDILTFANEIYDKANAKKAGSDNGWCARTVVGKAWECIWTTTLAEGQITVEGPFYDTADSELAITGGTGEYAEASGSLALHARNDKGTEYDFVFKLK